MSDKRVRIGVRPGYDLWASSYDATPNPLVALDRRTTLRALAPRPGEWILDAGCGTGAHLARLTGAGARVVGLDFSAGMLRVARCAAPHSFLVQADLQAPLPVRRRAFDAVLCALVSEHLSDPARFFTAAFDVLRPGGRLVFSAFHPELAATGVEANFELDGIEYRLGAELHTVSDFMTAVDAAGFGTVQSSEHRGDAALVAQVPAAAKYLGRPLLLVITALRP